MAEPLSPQMARMRAAWSTKPVLRQLYREQFFAPLRDLRSPLQPTVELGAGQGFLREEDPSVISTDLVRLPGLSLAADSQRLPFRSGSVGNVIGLDVLHHFADPVAALREIARVLQPGGRCVLVEPWITPLAYVIYRWFHSEDCDLSLQLPLGPKEPLEGNAAIPYLCFGPQARARAVTGLRTVELAPFCSLTYLLSLGFARSSLLPAALYRPLYALERATLPLWRRLFALRALIVLEKER